MLVEEATIPGIASVVVTNKDWHVDRKQSAWFRVLRRVPAFTFYCDTDWDVRAYFEEWMQTIVNPQTKEPAFYDEGIGLGEVDVIALDKQDDRAKRWTLKEAFPRLLNITPVAQGGDGVVRVAVTFSYRSWEASTTGRALSVILSEI